MLINQLNSDQILENQKLKIHKKEDKLTELKPVQSITPVNKVVQIS